MGTGEARLPAVQTQVRALIDLVLLPGAEALHDLILAGYNRGQIDADILCPNAPPWGVAPVMGHLSGSNHRLRWGAARIDAGAAQVFFLDQGHGPSVIGQLLRERVSGLARPDDNRIVFHRRSSFCSATRRFRDSSYPRLGFLEPRQKILPPAFGQCLHLDSAGISKSAALYLFVMYKRVISGTATPLPSRAITSIRSPAPTSPSRKTEK